LAVVLASEFTVLCTIPKAPLVAELGWVVGASTSQLNAMQLLRVNT
jgi:hypothetical protein